MFTASLAQTRSKRDVFSCANPQRLLRYDHGRTTIIRRSRRWAKANSLIERVEKGRGKGGHVTQYIGERHTVVKSGEIKTGLLLAMLKQLDIPKQEF